MPSFYTPEQRPSTHFSSFVLSSLCWLFSFGFTGLSATVQAQNLAGWPFSSSTLPSSTSQATGTTSPGAVTNNAGASSTVASGYLSCNNWPGTTAPDLAKYIEFQVQPTGNYDITVNGAIMILSSSSTANGPKDYELRLSTDNFATPVGTNTGGTAIANGTRTFTTAISGVNRIATAFSVRVYFYNAQQAGTDIRVSSFKLTGTAQQPTVTVIPATLSGFSTPLSVPSATKTYTLSGSNLFGDATLTAPVGYEISTSAGSGFATTLTIAQNSGSIPSTTIYVRLTGAAVGAQSGNITNVSSGVTANVAVSGTVLQPALAVTPFSLSGFTTTYGTPSAAQSYVLSGTGLSAAATLTAPAGYEISISSGSGFTSSLTIPQSGGTITNTTIYVRLTGNTAGALPGNITNVSTGSNNPNVTLTGTTLPVELVSFKGQAVGNSVVLNWATASELNAEQFVVQRSTDASEFVSVGSRQALGTTTRQQYYSLTDESPRNGVNYYRLKQIDQDGSTVYSKAIAVRVDASQPYASLAENPTDGQAIQLRLYQMEAPQVRLSSLAGRHIAGRLTLRSTTEAVYTPTDALAPGLYIITVQDGAVRQAMSVLVK